MYEALGGDITAVEAMQGVAPWSRVVKERSNVQDRVTKEYKKTRKWEEEVERLPDKQAARAALRRGVRDANAKMVRKAHLEMLSLGYTRSEIGKAIQYNDPARRKSKLYRRLSELERAREGNDPTLGMTRQLAFWAETIVGQPITEEERTEAARQYKEMLANKAYETLKRASGG